MLDPNQCAAFADEVTRFSGEGKGKPAERSVVIARGNDELFADEDADLAIDVMSCTKSFTVTAAGLLVDAGKCMLDTKAADYLDFLRDDYAGVTIRHLLTMTSGYNAVGGTYGQQVDGNWTDGSTTFDQPAAPLFEPGTMWHYHDDAIRTLGLLLNTIAGENIDDLYRREVGDVIGLDFNWGSYHGGPIQPDSGSGVICSARDVVKHCRLWLNRGKHDDRQLLSEAFVEQATSLQTKGIPPYEGPFFRGLDGASRFGFMWRTNAGGDLPALPRDAFWISGWNHNRLFVAPSLDLIVTRTGIDGYVGDDLAKWNTAFETLLA
ncbi:MAG: serine hydrolase domain-containing protein [Planctomycetota bacterium]